MKTIEQQLNQPATVKDIENILDEKLDEKLKDYPTRQEIGFILDEKFKDYPTTKYFDSKMDRVISLLDKSAKDYSTFKEEKKVVSHRLDDLETLHEVELRGLRTAPARENL